MGQPTPVHQPTPVQTPNIDLYADLIDLERYPLGDLGGPLGQALIAEKRRALRDTGSFNLEGFLRPEAVTASVAEVEAMMAARAFRHRQEHNIYFLPDDPPLPDGHGARARLISSNRTLTCDQLAGTTIRRIYEWSPLADFLAAVFDKPALYRMADPLAGLNVMGYGAEDRLNWHFDRAEFTVTLLLQAPEAGGIFEYRRNLRSADDPNHDGVARLLAGEDPDVRALTIPAGTLNVFMGYRSPHHVTPVEGRRMRLIAVLSFMETPDVQFSAADRKQFYGRAEPEV